MPGANAIRRDCVHDLASKEIFEVQPVILGGSPTDPANKTILTRQQHIEAVRYWNNIIRDIQKHRKTQR